MEPKCKKCKKEMDSYYGYWCPRCNVPPEETKRVLNLIQTITYIRTHNNWTDDEVHENFWIKHIVDGDNLKGNDSYMRYYIDDSTEAYKILNSDKYVLAFENHLKSQGFKDGDEVLFWVSW